MEFSTGSLGQGLSIGVGAALASRLSKETKNVFVLLSDAECQEGSSWEAAMFAGHQQLSKLCAIIDCNGLQAMGPTKDILDQSQLAERWRTMGWETEHCDGHDIESLCTAIGKLKKSVKPLAVIANTIGGKGVSYMENSVKWHYWPMSDNEFTIAMNEQQKSWYGYYFDDQSELIIHSMTFADSWKLTTPINDITTYSNIHPPLLVMFLGTAIKLTNIFYGPPIVEIICMILTFCLIIQKHPSTHSFLLPL